MRARIPARDELVSLTTELNNATQGNLHSLYYALRVLDDEPLVALHRPTRTGYRLRISGLGDNFQLHTLLMGSLAQHIFFEPPGSHAIAVCRDTPGEVPTTGRFNLVAPDGFWIWNEGAPEDIPVVRGTRLLVLDPPPYQRGWNAGRLFPRMVGDLTLERVLTPEETAAWFAEVAPSLTIQEQFPQGGAG